MIDISIVLKTRNEEKYIEKNLDMIFSQKIAKEFEVIVIDSGSVDKTLQIANSFNVRIYEISPKDFTYGKTQNLGFELSRGKIGVSLTAHVIPTSIYWLNNLTKPLFEDERIAGVFGRQVSRSDCNPLEERLLLKGFGKAKRYYKNPDTVFFSNSNSAIRLDIWKYFRFNEELPYAEDLDWGKRILSTNRGLKILYEPSAEAYHTDNDPVEKIYIREKKEWTAKRMIGLCKRASYISLITNFIGSVTLDYIWILKNIRRHDPRWLFKTPYYRFYYFYGKYKGLKPILKLI
jgi:rhamnosyltransferase